MDTLKPSALTTELLNTGQSGVPLVICSEAPRGAMSRKDTIEISGFLSNVFF